MRDSSFQLALGHHRAGRLREAAQLYQQILERDPRDGHALHMLGLLLAQLGRHELAADYLREAIGLMPQDPALHTELGEILRRAGRLEQAAAACRQAIALQADFVDAHYNLGVVLQQSGQAEEAMAAYRRTLALEANHVDALYNLANALKDAGRLEEAIATYRRALASKPDHVHARGNLGLALQAHGQLDAALACFRQVIAAQPADPLAHNAMATVLRAQGLLGEAIAAYRRALALKTDYVEAWNNLGKALEEAGQPDEALGCYRRAVELGSEHAEPYQNLGLALQKRGQMTEAVALFKQALARGVSSPEARFHMAAAIGEAVPARPPASHIVATFDAMAPKFDAHLVGQLAYRGPELLFEAVTGAVRPGAKDLVVLDLGCGTGLCGPWFRPLARRLVGVDLAPAMIERARGRGVYDELLTGELVEAMAERAGSFDLILAADVLVYFGDLAEVFAAASGALRARGLFAFFVEAWDDPPERQETGYTLKPTRRYVHTAGYLRRLAGASGLAEVSLTRAAIRQEEGRDVAGLVMVVRKGG